MAPVDWIMMATLLGSVLLGAWRGLVFEVLSVAGWIAAFIMTQLCAPQVADALPMAGATEPMRYAAGFVLIFLFFMVTAGDSGLFQFIPGTWAANSPRAGYAGASPFDAVASANTAAMMFSRGQAWQWTCK